MNENRKNNIYLIVVMVAICIFECIQIPRFKFYVQSDDFGYIANAAYFAGYSWTPYTGDITPYYPPGFSWSVAPLFRLLNSPVSIYRALLLYIVILQCILAYLVFKICIIHLQITERESALLTLVYSLGSLAPQAGLYFLAEVPFAICYLFSIDCFLNAEKSTGKRKSIYSILCAVTVAYSYMVHARFLVLFVLIALMSVCARIKYKRMPISSRAYAISFLISFICFFSIARHIRNSLYMSTVRDITLTDPLTRASWLPNMLRSLLSIEMFSKFLQVFFSIQGSITILTGGFIWVFAFLTVRMLKDSSKKEIVDDEIFFTLSMFAILGYLFMNIAVSLNGMINYSLGEEKWLTYYRYARPFAGIIVLTGGMVMFQEIKKYLSTISLSVLFSSLLCFFLIKYTAVVLSDTEHVDVSPVGWFRYYFYYDQDPMVYFYLFSSIVLSIQLVCWIMFRKEKIKMALILFLIFSIALSISENRWNEINMSQKNYEMIANTLSFVQSNTLSDEVTLCYGQESYAGKLRYALFDKELTFYLDTENYRRIDYQTSILFTQMPDLKDLYGIEAECFRLGDYEYLYTNHPLTIELVANWLSMQKN